MSNKKSLFFTLLFLSNLFLSGCVDSETAPGSDVVPQEVAVSITPSATTLPTGGEQIFQASVTGSGNKAVTWSVQENLPESLPGGSIVSTISTGVDGAYTAPASGGTFHVVATSQVDSQKTATATVTVSSTLDAVFGINGKVSTPFGGMDTINALVTQPDGKIVVGGSSLNGSETDFALARYHSDGNLDTSFGKGGIVVTSLGGSSEINALIIQSDGRIVAGGSSSNVLNSDFALARYQADGSLDSTFGSGSTGIVITKVGLGNDVLNALVLQPDGKIVSGGFSFVPKGTLFSIGDNQFSLVRFQSNGTVDTGFGTKGVVVTPFGSNESGEIRALALQPDGKIVAGGFSSQSGNDFALVRYNTDGNLDISFDGDGIVKTDIGGGDDQIHALIISGGIIFAGGHASIASNKDFALARYDSTGTLVGTTTTPIGSGADEIKALAIQSDGKIVVGGFFSNGANNDFALARYNIDGSLDTTGFGAGGMVKTAVGAGTDEIKAIAIQSNKIIVGGFSSKGLRSDFALARYDSTGNLDTAFDTDGIQTTSVGGGSDVINALALQSDGKIVVAGFSFGVNSIKNNEFSLARYGSDGALDTSFDADGKVTTPIGSGDDEISALAIQSDGQIVVAGTAFTGTKDDFALARYNASDGALDTSFDADGKVTTSMGTGDDEVNALILQADGKIVVAGTAFTGTNSNFALARYNTNGGLDTIGFGTGGKVTTQIGTGSSFARAMAIQTDGMIVVVGISSVPSALPNESDFDVALVRYLSDGSPDPGFGTNGIVTTPIGTEQDMATAVALQTDGKILVAGTAFTGSGVEDFVLLRYNINGSLDTDFGVGGKTMTPIGTLANAPLAVKVQTDGKIVVGGYTSSVLNGRDFALVRYNSDGSLDMGFGVDGIEISPFSAGGDEIHDIELSNGKILAVGMSTNGNGENTDFHLAQYAPAP